MARREETGPVIVKIPQGTEKTAENLNLYLVDGQGNVAESHSLRSGDIELKAQNLQGAKVYIAPRLPAELEQVTINEKALLNMGAWQPSVRLNNNVFQIPYFPHFPFPFPFGFCSITGVVTKTFNVNGQPQVLPICDAKVHICDVERIWIIINRIPDSVLNELRQRLVAIIRNPIPIPDPGPEFGAEIESFQVRSVAAPAAPLTALPNLPEIPVNVQSSILSGSVESFKTAILNNFGVFHPYLCWWPWFWPWFYEIEEVATVVTDCNGRFDYNMLYFLKNHPNVYVWVEVLIGGVWTTVYRPWVSCFTYWNYACGTDINISLTNPDVLPCNCSAPPTEDDHVWVKSVNSLSIHTIQQSTDPSGHLTNAVGLTAYGGYGNISPFGGSFPFSVGFGDGFDALGVKYYRWSYTQTTDAYLQTLLNGPYILKTFASRPYDHWVEVTPGNWENLGGSFSLGPVLDTSNRPMYKIPHSDAAIDTGITGAVWESQYTPSVNINTVGWDPGLYQFTLELLDTNGNVVPLPNPFKLDDLSSPPDTVAADGTYVTFDGSGKAISFNFLMRIDNNPCYAGISDAKVAGGTTDTECGTGYYNDKNTDTVDLYFQAGHPHNFATYTFNVYKGNSGALAIAGSGGTSANANNVTPLTAVTSGDNGYGITLVNIPVPPFPLPPNPVNPVSNMDQYHKNIAVSAMLGSCNMAAFSENVNVYATHTNGSTQLSGYNTSYVAAIAIAPNS